MAIENTTTLISFIAGPAILTNACAIMLSGASGRYGLAIPQWREFRSLLAAHQGRLSDYTDTSAAIVLAERRILLLLRTMSFLHLAVVLFASSTLLALLAAMSSALFILGWLLMPLLALMASCAAAGLAFLIAATFAYMSEGACGRSLLKLHMRMDAFGAPSSVASSSVVVPDVED